ncbi:MAG: BamA/TamA family outer membrane protein [Prevotella sp.]|nr:BamA/TamA family outer membrane protein [Prevotella sp.]
MIKQALNISFFLVVILILSSCSASKFIPEGQFMLDDVGINSDTKAIRANQLEPYIRQKGNSKWFSVLKVPLGTYALAGRDTTKWINRKLQDWGENPVLLDTLQADLTCNDISNVLHGMGYVKAYVDYDIVFEKNKKVKIFYNLHTGPQFYIKSISYDIQDKKIASILESPNVPQTKLHKGMSFQVNALDEERKRISNYLNDNGFFAFNKDFITFSADTVSGSNMIDLTLHLHRFYRNKESETDHQQYTINNISYSAGGGNNRIPLRKSVLLESTLFETGNLFSASNLQKTYNKFSRLGVIKYTNIKFTEATDSNLLNCNIEISTNKTNSISFQPEGTNTSGDLGAALSITYENKNIFKGAETFSVKLRGAFEAITGLEGYQNQNYMEYSLETTLTFPRFIIPFLSRNYKRRSTASSELSASYNMQNRPEFHRRLFDAGWRYKWSNSSKRKTFKVDLLELNYIYMPWISNTFKEEYLDNSTSRNSILKYNYEDLFIMKFGFGMTYNNGNDAYKINVETSGNLLDGLTNLFGSQVNSDGQHTLINIAFAQYVKGDFDYTHLFRFTQHNNLAFHFGFGIAYPYGNSKVLPFEKRYFSGGANSVRGWSVRGLGPGKYKGSNGSIDFINQTGDLKLDINLEWRTLLFWKFYGALFADAGNIWTLRYYDEQPGGQFCITDFYKQIAVAYGLGIRLNFDYFILRFDMGMKAINPAYDTQQEHYAIFHPDFSRDFTFHFAVGLPF